jgi:hypothetical protein
MKRLLGWLLMMCLIAACSDPDQGPPLGPFAAITKTLADKPFDIVPPSSRSPAPFTYTSSKPEVATISGSTVTITGVGVTMITASQSRIGSYGPTSASTTLTVTAAPPTSASAFTAGSVMWMGVDKQDTWAKARDFCAGSTIEGKTGWRQPTEAELTDLQKSSAISGHGWSLGATWSSTAGKAASTNHVVVDLSNGTRVERSDTDSAYVSCVH